MKKRILPVLLALVIVLGLLPLVALAADSTAGESITYSVAVTCTEGGGSVYVLGPSNAIIWSTLNPDKEPSPVSEGETVGITAIANENENYTIKELSVTSESNSSKIELTPVNVTEGSVYYTFTMPASNVKVNVVFEQKKADAQKYGITIMSPNVGKGTLAADKTEAAEGDTVTLSVVPEKGYTLIALIVLPVKTGEIEDKEEISTENKEEGTYTFTMPGFAVQVFASFKEESITPDQEALAAAYKEGGVIGGTISLSGLTAGHTYICEISRTKTSTEYEGSNIPVHDGTNTVAIMFEATGSTQDILTLKSSSEKYFVSVWGTESKTPSSLSDFTISSLNLTEVTAS